MIDATAHEAATSPQNDLPEPTQAQKEAGNYKKGHTTWNGLGLTIENPKGSERRGVDPGGKAWRVEMPAHYGYVKRTEGNDGDQVDLYMGPNPDSGRVFVVDQVSDRTGAFDEHKAIAGVDGLQQAIDLYDAGFSDGKGPQRRGAVTEMTVDQFKAWVRDGVKNQPVGTLNPTTKDQPAHVPQPSPPAAQEGQAPDAQAEAPKPGSATGQGDAAGWWNGLTQDQRAAEIARIDLRTTKGKPANPAHTWMLLSKAAQEKVRAAFEARPTAEESSPVAPPAITSETASDVKDGPALKNEQVTVRAPAVAGDSSATQPADPLDTRLQAAADTLKDDQQVTIPVQVGDTGKTAEMTLGAKDAVADVRKRLGDALQLMRCLK